MKKHMILASHGHFAKGALGSLEMIIGYQLENVDSLSVVAGESADQAFDNLKALYDKVSEDAEVFIFTDIYGGTPSNVALKLSMSHKNITLFSGLNLPTLLEAVLTPATSKEELIETIETAAKKSFVNVSRLLKERNNDDDDEY